jgi:hypothetical protein
MLILILLIQAAGGATPVAGLNGTTQAFLEWVTAKVAVTSNHRR